MLSHVGDNSCLAGGAAPPPPPPTSNSGSGTSGSTGSTVLTPSTSATSSNPISPAPTSPSGASHSSSPTNSGYVLFSYLGMLAELLVVRTLLVALPALVLAAQPLLVLAWPTLLPLAQPVLLVLSLLLSWLKIRQLDHQCCLEKGLLLLQASCVWFFSSAYGQNSYYPRSILRSEGFWHRSPLLSLHTPCLGPATSTLHQSL